MSLSHSGGAITGKVRITEINQGTQNALHSIHRGVKSVALLRAASNSLLALRLTGQDRGAAWWTIAPSKLPNHGIHRISCQCPDIVGEKRKVSIPGNLLLAYPGALFLARHIDSRQLQLPYKTDTNETPDWACKSITAGARCF